MKDQYAILLFIRIPLAIACNFHHPGKWDNMVCGGLSVGYGVRETAIKEAAEEASIPEHLTTDMRPAGAISLFFESERGLFPNTEYVFDLELPLDFVPFNADGEVQDFALLSARDCYERLFSDDFKTTSVPVVLDFLIRQGLVTPETEPNYTQVLELLHVPLQGLLGDPMDPVTCRRAELHNEIRIGNGSIAPH